MPYHKHKSDIPYTYESLQQLYGALIGDAVVIQPIYTDVSPEENRYSLIDVAYDMSLHFHNLYGTPHLRTKDLTRHNLTMYQCIQHAEICIAELRKSQFEYYQPYHQSGTRKRKNSGVKQNSQKTP